MSLFALLLIALTALCATFGLLYLVARRMDNYGIVDIAWSYAFGALAAFYALAGPGWPVRRALIATMAVLWSARLGTHLAIRVIGHHPVEDGRYQQLRKDWAGNFTAKMAGFFQMQAVSVVLLGAAFLVVCVNPTPALHPLELAGAALWSSSSSPSAARHSPTPSWPPSSVTPPTRGRSATSACGTTAGTPTTSSNGSSGWPILSSRSVPPGAGSPSSARPASFTCCCA